MKWSTTILLLSVLSCAAVAGDPPKPDKAEAVVVLTAEDPEPGDIIELDASDSVGEFFAWSVWPLLMGDRLTLRPDSDGRGAVLASKPGTYVVTLAVGSQTSIAITNLVVVIKGDIQPEPGPGPDPEPDLPDLRYGLAPMVVEWSKAVKSHRDGAALIAKPFRLIASQIAAGALKDPKAITDGLKAAMTDKETGVPPEVLTAWNPWADNVMVVLTELHDAGEIKVPNDFADAYREVALGLEAVK